MCGPGAQDLAAAALGGAVGFMVGGPAGAYYGATTAAGASKGSREVKKQQKAADTRYQEQVKSQQEQAKAIVAQQQWEAGKAQTKFAEEIKRGRVAAGRGLLTRTGSVDATMLAGKTKLGQ